MSHINTINRIEKLNAYEVRVWDDIVKKKCPIVTQHNKFLLESFRSNDAYGSIPTTV